MLRFASIALLDVSDKARDTARAHAHPPWFTTLDMLDDRTLLEALRLSADEVSGDFPQYGMSLRRLHSELQTQTGIVDQKKGVCESNAADNTKHSNPSEYDKVDINKAEQLVQAMQDSRAGELDRKVRICTDTAPNPWLISH